MIVIRQVVPIACALVIGASVLGQAQSRREFVGPAKCTDCHDHKDEKEWSEKRDGDGKGKQHLNALNQLSDAKADDYAKAIGLKDVYDAKGTCVKCHATIVRGSADFGISCESCHGAGKDYLKPHQEKGAYQASLALGLKDTVKKPDAWVKDCVTCHVLGENPGDAALIKAGHSSGDQFDLGQKFQPVSSHWTSKYTANQIASLGNPLRKLTADKRKSAPTATTAGSTGGGSVAPPGPASGPTAGLSPPPLPPPGVTGDVVPSPPPPPPPPSPPGRSGGRPLPDPPTPPPAPQPTTPVITAVIDAPVAQTPASLVGALQGRVAQLLGDLLTRGVRTPVKLTSSATKTPYRGPDAELLRLQEEVIALALEALGTAPPAKTPPLPK